MIVLLHVQEFLSIFIQWVYYKIGQDFLDSLLSISKIYHKYVQHLLKYNPKILSEMNAPFLPYFDTQHSICEMIFFNESKSAVLSKQI